MSCEVTHCTGHISANTRPHQLHWGMHGLCLSCKLEGHSYLAEVSDYILYSISYVTRPQHPISSMLVYIRIYIYIYIYIGTSLKSTPEIRTPCFIRTIPSCPNWRGSTKYVAISKCNFLSAYQHIRHPTCCYRNMNILSN